MKHYSKSQLNAINYERVRRNQEKARSELLDHYGIDFVEFSWFTGYNASPCRLCTDIHRDTKATMKLIRMYALFLIEEYQETTKARQEYLSMMWNIAKEEYLDGVRKDTE